MNCRIILTDEFKRQVKKLAKKHRSIKNDIKFFFDSIMENPYQGDKIGENIYKVRIAIKSKGKGKSGGARVINYVDVKIKDDSEQIDVYILAIYDKSDAESVSSSYVSQMIKEIQEEE